MVRASPGAPHFESLVTGWAVGPPALTVVHKTAVDPRCKDLRALVTPAPQLENTSRSGKYVLSNSSPDPVVELIVSMLLNLLYSWVIIWWYSLITIRRRCRWSSRTRVYFFLPAFFSTTFPPSYFVPPSPKSMCIVEGAKADRQLHTCAFAHDKIKQLVRQTARFPPFELRVRV